MRQVNPLLVLSSGLLLAAVPAGAAAAAPAPLLTAYGTSYQAYALKLGTAHRLRAGVTWRAFTATPGGKTVHGEVLDVDLRASGVRADLLRPPVVAARLKLTAMAAARHALAAVNGDFFATSEEHPGLTPTGAPSGPEVAGGHAVKGPVPNAQRFGAPLPPGTSTADALAFGTDGTVTMTTLRLSGTATSARGTIPLRGLNQYALPAGGTGVFTPAWGTAPRKRSTCGSDTSRAAPCGTDTAEAVIKSGVVQRTGAVDATGKIATGTAVLVGRDAGAAAVRKLKPGDHVTLSYRLAGSGGLRFALGGFPLMRSGTPLAGLDPTRHPRTAAGIAAGGHRLLLVVVDGRSTASAGIGLPDLAALLRTLGATGGWNLDGGGSSTFVTGKTIRNVPSDHVERPVANGIGVFG